MKMHLKLTLYHEPVVVEIDLPQRAKTKAQSTKFKVTLDKTLVLVATRPLFPLVHKGYMDEKVRL